MTIARLKRLLKPAISAQSKRASEAAHAGDNRLALSLMAQAKALQLVYDATFDKSDDLENMGEWEP